MRNIVLTFLLAFVSFQVFANQDELKNTFIKANDLYSSGEYQQAIDNYQTILDSGYESASLYYNIGNCHYKAENIPAAILHLEKALKSDPSNEDVRFNLKLANLKIVDKIEPIPEMPLKQWWKSLVFSNSVNGWGWLAINFLFLSALLFGAFVVMKYVTIKKLAFYTGIIAIFFSIFFFSLGYQQKSIINNSKYSIVIAPTLTVHSSPDGSGTKLFAIHEGTKVQELEILQDWVKIKLANGNVGWVKEEALVKI